MPIKKLLNHLSEQYLSNSQPLKTTRSLTQCKVLRKNRSGHPCFGTWHPIDRYCFFCFKVKHFPIPLTKNEQTARPPNKTPQPTPWLRAVNSVTYLPQAPFRLTLLKQKQFAPENGCLEDDSFPFKHGELFVLGRVVYKKRQFSRRFRTQRFLGFPVVGFNPKRRASRNFRHAAKAASNWLRL